MTTVVNLETGEEVRYTLPPALAVVAAYEYFTRKNKSTWDYLKPVDHPQFVDGRLTVACGDWAAAKVNKNHV